MLQIKSFVLILVSILSGQLFAQNPSEEDKLKLVILTALSSDTDEGFEKATAQLSQLTKDDSLAYSGTLFMKMSQYHSLPMDKLKSFKTGKASLEEVISRNTYNCEYRFLRFIIQANAPDFLKYNINLKEDAKFIEEHYKELSPALQKVVLGVAAKMDGLSISQ